MNHDYDTLWGTISAMIANLHAEIWNLDLQYTKKACYSLNNDAQQ
jgi:hypothetical protein